MKIKAVILLGFSLLISSALYGQMQAAPTLGPAMAQPPMTEKEVISELKKQGAGQVIKDVGARGVDFEMDADTDKRLRKAKATDEVIKAVTQAGPKERTAAAKATAAASGELQLSKDEASEYAALRSELDPDKSIANAEAFAKKYPKSQALTYVYAIEARDYQAKGDAEKIVDYAQKSLALKSDNLMSLLFAADIIPQSQYMNHHRNNEEQLLDQAEGYCQEAFKVIDGLKKPPESDDATFAKDKADYTASVHSYLGMIHLDRAQLGLLSLDTGELDKAIGEYKQAISMATHVDARDYFRMGEGYKLLGKYDDAITAFGKASELSNGRLKQLADAEVASVKQAKAQAAAPAKP